MITKKTPSAEEISVLVHRIADEFASQDRAEMETMAKLPPGERWLVICRKSEEIRSDLRDELRNEFPELSLSEINMKVPRSLTPVRMGKSCTEPAYYEWLC